MSDAREIGLGIGTLLSSGASLVASMADGDVAVWVERVGFPIALVLAIGWGAVRVSRWLGSNVIEPVTKRHVSLMDTLDATQRQQADALTRIADSEARTLECVTRLEESVVEERKTSRLALEGVREALTRLADESRDARAA